MRNRIETLDELKERVTDLFHQSHLEMNAFRKHQVGFMVEGTPKSVQALLALVTNPSKWSVTDRVLWMYQDEEENLILALSKAGRGKVLVLASIASLHKKYMDEVLADFLKSNQ